jgi:hypothetical protein
MEGIIEEEGIPTGNSGLTHIITDVEMMSLGLLTGFLLWPYLSFFCRGVSPSKIGLIAPY